MKTHRATLMFVRLIAPLLLLIAAPSCAAGTFPAKELQFKVWFASRAGDPVTYCLLGTGFFRAFSAGDIDAMIAGWLAAHRNAEAIPVSTIDGQKETQRITYIWLLDGSENLNEFLIREGAVAGGTMIDASDYFDVLRAQLTTKSGPSNALPAREEIHRLVSDDRYHAFLDRIRAAELAAKAEHRGIWAKEYDDLRSDE